MLTELTTLPVALEPPSSQYFMRTHIIYHILYIIYLISYVQSYIMIQELYVNAFKCSSFSSTSPVADAESPGFTSSSLHSQLEACLSGLVHGMTLTDLLSIEIELDWVKLD